MRLLIRKYHLNWIHNIPAPNTLYLGKLQDKFETTYTYNTVTNLENNLYCAIDNVA